MKADNHVLKGKGTGKVLKYMEREDYIVKVRAQHGKQNIARLVRKV